MAKAGRRAGEPPSVRAGQRRPLWGRDSLSWRKGRSQSRQQLWADGAVGMGPAREHLCLPGMGQMQATTQTCGAWGQDLRLWNRRRQSADPRPGCHGTAECVSAQRKGSRGTYFCLVFLTDHSGYWIGKGARPVRRRLWQPDENNESHDPAVRQRQTERRRWVT